MKKIAYYHCLVIALLLTFIGCNHETHETIKPELLKDAVVDFDGNSYDAVKLGNQIWMASNLRVTHFPNGNEIPTIIRDDYYNITEPSKYMPNDNPELVATNGYLYNWYAAVNGETASSSNPSGVQGICPDGWHLPSRAEWTELTDYLGSHEEYCAGGATNIAKSLASTTGWNSSSNDYAVGNNQSENNKACFNAYPVGSYTGNGSTGMGSFAQFWTSEETGGERAYDFIIRHAKPTTVIFDDSKYYGISIRCIRN